jgi:pyruvate formate lyase activating enzyme
MQAYVARLEPLSDRWHGIVSAALFLAGCDFSCPQCNAGESLRQKQEYLRDVRDITRELSLHLGSIKGLMFTGGEPCLQRAALVGIAGFAKEHGLKVGLETNGAKPDCLRTLLTLKLLDFIAIDLKAPFKEEPFEHATHSRTFFKPTSSLIADVRSSIELLSHHHEVAIEVRLTITPTVLFRKEDVLAIADEIKSLRATLVLQSFSPEGVGNERFRLIKGPSHEFLETLREAVQKEYPNMHIILDSRLS